MWYEGQKVVCVNAKSASNWKYNPLNDGSIYVVAGTRNCVCGVVALDIGIPSYYIGVRCACGSETSDGIWLFRDTRFRPLDTLEEQIERIESESAPVELEPEYA